MSAIEIFQQHGLRFNDAEQAMVKLAELDTDELWTLTEQLIGKEPIGISGDEDIQASILRLTLVNAFTNNSEHITQNDVDLAQETALSLLGDIADATATTNTDSVSDNTNTDVAVGADSDEEPPAKKRNRKRTSVSREAIKALVSADTNATRDHIISQVMGSTDVNVSEATAVMYFYDVRKELGLETNGKRGRKTTNTVDRVKQLLLDNPDKERSDLIDLIVSELGYKKNTATVYYHNGINALKEENQA